MKASLLLLLLVAPALGHRAAAQHLTPTRIVTMAGEKIGYVNKRGEVLIKPIYEAGEEFTNGLARVRLAGRYGLVDSLGNTVVPLKYKDLGYFYDGLAAASLDGTHYGYITMQNTVAIPFTFQEAGNFSDGTAPVASNLKIAIINKRGVLLTPYRYVKVEPMQGGIARVCLRNDSRDGIEHSHYWGFVNAQGKELTPPTLYGYESPNLGNGYAVARLATPDGRPTSHQGTTPNGTRYTLKLGQGYTYKSLLIDKTGKAIIPASAGYEFGNWGADYIIVEHDERVGVAALATGKLLLPVNFHAISDFEYGSPEKPLARVTTTEDGQFFYVNRQWQPTEYDGVKPPAY